MSNAVKNKHYSMTCKCALYKKREAKHITELLTGFEIERAAGDDVDAPVPVAVAVEECCSGCTESLGFDACIAFDSKTIRYDERA